MQAQQITKDVLLEKYAKDSETSANEIFRRVARGIASVETQKEVWEKTFFNNMIHGAIGAGRIMSNAGTDIQATLINCFVQPVGDAIQGTDENGVPGIYEALRQAAETMRRGGGVGYDFSKIRPKNAKVKGTNSNASGPCSYMDVFDMSCKTVESAGARRGAQMGVLRIDHPDVLEFVRAKRTPGRWNNFNVSVFVPDEFMRCKDSSARWELVHSAEPSRKLQSAGAYKREDGKWVYEVVEAQDLWDSIMQSNYDFAEPGVLFANKINADNNLRYIETLEATNPCAEQPLPSYGCCCLAQVLLPMFVNAPFTEDANFDYERFKATVATQVRFLDNVLEATYWPLSEQKTEAMNKRRVGLGYTGLGNALAMLNKRYNSSEGLELARVITETMCNAAYLASVELAKERGPFPLFDKVKYLEEGTFASRLPDPIKDAIREYGIRNSHLISIAPTGTTSLAFGDNCSNGIEPPFSYAYSRKKRMADGSEQHYAVVDHGLRVFLNQMINTDLADALLVALCAYKLDFEFAGKTVRVKDVLPTSMVTAMDMTAAEHLAMLQVVQPHVDSSISKTVNVPGNYPFADFKAIYDSSWKFGLKGVSTYRPNSILGSVLSVGTPAAIDVKAETASVDPLHVMISKRPDGEVESKTSKVRYSGFSGDQTLYITVSFTTVAGVCDGKYCEIERPLEVFVQASPDGVPVDWVTAYARNLSLLARAGLLAKALQDNRSVKSDKGRVRYGWYEKADGSKVPRFHDSEVACVAFAVQEILKKRGLLDDFGNQVSTKDLLKANPRKEIGVEKFVDQSLMQKATVISQETAGRKCSECGAHAVIKKDGCEFCTHCGHNGACG